MLCGQRNWRFASAIGDIVAGQRAVTADTEFLLCRYFGLSDGWWPRGQAGYDTVLAKEAMRDVLARNPRCARWSRRLDDG
jgi:antitoxin HigA-1